MNIGQIFLVLHLLGASFIALLMLTSFIVLIKRKSSYYKPLAVSVAISTSFQLISGSLLALNYQNSESILSFCSKVGFYLFTVLVVELFLFKRLYAENLYPSKIIVSSLTLGMVFVFVTLLHL